MNFILMMTRCYPKKPGNILKTSGAVESFNLSIQIVYRPEGETLYLEKTYQVIISKNADELYLSF